MSYQLNVVNVYKAERNVNRKSAVALILPLATAPDETDCWKCKCDELKETAVQAHKVYLTDPGLAAHVRRADIDWFRDQPTLTGFLMENFVLSELLKPASWNSSPMKLSCFRTRSGIESDINLADQKQRIVGIEVQTEM